MRILVKKKLYYIRLPQGYIRAMYIGSKGKRRTFITIDGRNKYILSPLEVYRYVTLLPKRGKAIERLKRVKRFNQEVKKYENL